MPIVKHIKVIEKINSFIKEESGEVILKIQPRKFRKVYPEETGQIILNEILNFLGFNSVENLDDILVDDAYIKDNI